MGNERSLPAGAVCSGCSGNLAVGPEAGHKWRECCAPRCNIVYCGHCKHRVMYKIQTGRWLCPNHGSKFKEAKARGEDPEKNFLSEKQKGLGAKQVSAIDVGAMKRVAASPLGGGDKKSPGTPGLRLQTGAEMPKRKRPVSSRHPAIKHRLTPGNLDETIKKLHTESGSVEITRKSRASKGVAFGAPSPSPRATPSSTRSTSSPKEPKFWTFEEDQLLRSAVDLHGAKQWKQIAKLVPNRTHVQCLQRWNKVLRPGLRKGPWTPNEDHRLISCVKTNEKRKNVVVSELNWSEVAEQVPGRSAKQCRERWCFNLDPSINRDPWTPAEDAKLLKLQQEQGNKWAYIATMLPGRTENATKTRFKSLMRAKKRMWRPEEDAKIMKMHKEIGSRWDEIAANLPNRTKNAVKTRYKFLHAEAEKAKKNRRRGSSKSSRGRRRSSAKSTSSRKSGIRRGSSKSTKTLSPVFSTKKSNHRKTPTESSLSAFFPGKKEEEFFNPLPYNVSEGRPSSGRFKRRSSSRMSGKVMLQMLEDLATMDVDDASEVPSPNFDNPMEEFSWGQTPQGGAGLTPRAFRSSLLGTVPENRGSRHSSVASNRNSLSMKRSSMDEELRAFAEGGAAGTGTGTHSRLARQATANSMGAYLDTLDKELWDILDEMGDEGLDEADIMGLS